MAAQKTQRALLTLIAAFDANGNTDLLTGTALGTSTSTVGTLTVTALLISNAAGTSTGTAGVLSVPTTFVSSALGTSTGTTATITVAASFSGTAAGVSSCSSTLTFASLSSTASGDSSGTAATITVAASLSGTCFGTSSDTGALLTTSSLVGLSVGDSSGTVGVLTVEASWVSISASDSSGTSGSLTVTASLGPSTALGTSTGTGAILTTDSLVGRANGDSSGTSATLSVVIDFSSTANGRSRTLGRLTSAMSTQYGGKPANIVSSNAFAILSSTHTNPSVVTVGAPHGMLSDDEADISGHAVNTAINGVWPVTVISPTVFSVAVAANGAGGMTGQVQPMRLGATGAIPSDGDDEDAGSVNVSLETLFDRTAALAAWTGGYKLAIIKGFGSSSASVWGTFSTTDASFHPVTIPGGNPAGLPWVVDGIVPGDYVEMHMTGTVNTSVGAGSIAYNLSLGVALVPPGGSPSYTSEGNSHFPTQNEIGSNGYAEGPVSILTAVQVGAAGSLYIIPGVACDSGTAMGGGYWYGVACIVKVWRPTGQPQ